MHTELVVLYNSGMNYTKNKPVTVIGRLGSGWATDPFITAISKGIRVHGSYTLPEGTLGVLNRCRPHVSDVVIVDAGLPGYQQRLVISHILDKYEELSSKTRPDEEFNVTIKEEDLRRH